MQEGSKDGANSTVPDLKSVSFLGSTCFPSPVRTVCTATSGVCEPSLVSLAGGGQGVVGEDPEESSEYGVRTEGWHL